MNPIFHLVLPPHWDTAATEPYRAASLDKEGFIHCSHRPQVAWAANRFYAQAADLLVLEIDPARLTSPVRDEDAGWGERFPHIYGPLDRAAVVAVHRLRRDAEGRWVFPA
jgi:uncharacterized protein (DUF952 family)